MSISDARVNRELIDVFRRQRGLVVRALDLQSGGPFKSSSLPLAGFVSGHPEFNSSTLLK